ncbi:GTP-binding protein [Raineya sp.]|jgi:hypothetical protein
MILKLLISGDVGSGKTTFVKAISDIEPITTDEFVTEEATKQLKEYTTVAMDFGMLRIDEDLLLHIYATPGQKRFQFMWDVLMDNTFGVIFLADASRVDSIFETKSIIDYFCQKYSAFPYIVCVTKMDLEGSLSLPAIMELIPCEVPFLPINANNPLEVREAVIMLISMALH